MIRLALSGASGTGKTTLAEHVAEHYSLTICPVGSRSVAKSMGYENPYDVDAAGKRAKFQRRLIMEKADWESSHESFVTDRTVLDNLAYAMLHCVEAIDDGLLAIVRHAAQRYTHVAYCPVDVFCNTAGDPARVAEMAYQYVYDAAVFGLLLKTMRGHQLHVLNRADLNWRRRALIEHVAGAEVIYTTMRG